MTERGRPARRASSAWLSPLRRWISRSSLAVGVVMDPDVSECANGNDLGNVEPRLQREYLACRRAEGKTSPEVRAALKLLDEISVGARPELEGYWSRDVEGERGDRA